MGAKCTILDPTFNFFFFFWELYTYNFLIKNLWGMPEKNCSKVALCFFNPKLKMNLSFLQPSVINLISPWKKQGSFLFLRLDLEDISLGFENCFSSSYIHASMSITSLADFFLSFSWIIGRFLIRYTSLYFHIYI